MLVRHSYLAFALILMVGLFQQPTLRAQTATEWTPGAVPMGSQIGPYAAFPVIQGQPYTAEVVQQETVIRKDGKRLGEAHNIHRRDSDGRLLDESLPSPPVNTGGGVVRHGFTLVDPVQMLLMQWNDSTHTAVISSMHVQLPFQDNFQRFPCPNVGGWVKVEQQELGERMIQGVIAAGCRTTGVSHSDPPRRVVIETWRSQVLGVTLLSIRHDSDGNESRAEVRRLDLGEPELTKFEVPQEYKRITAR